LSLIKGISHSFISNGGTDLKSIQYFLLAILGSMYPLSITQASVTPKPPFSCSDRGSATAVDKVKLNKLKNRVTQAANPSQMTSAQINNLSTGPQANLNALETKAVFVEGFLVAVKQQGAESTNCGQEGSSADYHLWLVDNANQVDLTNDNTIRVSKANSTVIEITPRWRKSNPGWNLKTINRLIRQKAKFRITGWLMLDPEHPDQIGKTRGSLWEIHPITKIEVLNGSKWVEL
jgi:hypothetical protein